MSKQADEIVERLQKALVINQSDETREAYRIIDEVLGKDRSEDGPNREADSPRDNGVTASSDPPPTPELPEWLIWQGCLCALDVGDHYSVGRDLRARIEAALRENAERQIDHDTLRNYLGDPEIKRPIGRIIGEHRRFARENAELKAKNAELEAESAELQRSSWEDLG